VRVLEAALNARHVAMRIMSLLTDSIARPPILLHGIDATTWTLFDEAVILGHDVRIGLEDTLRMPNGESAHSNAWLVSEARRRLDAFTPQETA
jgi:uncharacterized protein (DUF849 family)